MNKEKSKYIAISGMFTVMGAAIHTSGGNRYLAYAGPIIGLIILFYYISKSSKK